MQISLNDDDFKNAFLSGKLVIDCTEIKLTQHDTDHPRIYAAPGFMEVSPQDGVKIRMVCKREANDRYDPFAMKYSEVEAGVLLSKKYFYKLEVTDVYGNLWTNEEVDINEHHYSESISIDVACEEVATVSSIESQRASVNFIFKEDLGFPINEKESREITKGTRFSKGSYRTLSTGIISGIEIFYDPRKYDAGEKYANFSAIYEDDVKPVSHFSDRLLESIIFCIAKSVTPVMSSVCVDGEKKITLRRDAQYVSKQDFMQKPVPTKYGESEHFYKLLECYFNHSCEEKMKKSKSSISLKMTALFSLHNLYFETRILLLSVAVESILKEKLFDAISNSTPSKLRYLMDIGVLSKDERDAWNDIRHSSVHGSFDMSKKDHQEYYDKSYKLLTAIYKLIFMCIGYSGKYNNYSTRGWSVADFDIDKYKAALDGSGLR